MRVLLTGASGFVGSHVLRHLLVNTDYEIVAPVSYRHRGTPDRVASAMGLHCQKHRACAGKSNWKHRVHIVHTDLRSEFTRTTLHQLGEIDQIWNIASESHVDRSITEPVEFVRSNVDIALAMAENARRLEPDLFLQMSTDEVFGPAESGYFHKEGERYRPSNPYSASKACQADILFSYWRTYGIPLIVTQTMNIVGETQDSEKFAPMVMQRVELGQMVGIHASPEGVIGSRCWLHARNLADAWLWLSENAVIQTYDRGHTEPSEFNIVGEERSNLEMAKMIADAMEKELRHSLVSFHQSRPGHDLRYALDGKKIADLGWKAPLSLDTSVEALVAWTMLHPEWLA